MVAIFYVEGPGPGRRQASPKPGRRQVRGQGGGKLTPLLTTKARFDCKNRTQHEVVQRLTWGTLCATLYDVTSIILFSGYSVVLSGAETYRRIHIWKE